MHHFVITKVLVWIQFHLRCLYGYNLAGGACTNSVLHRFLMIPKRIKSKKRKEKKVKEKKKKKIREEEEKKKTTIMDQQNDKKRTMRRYYVRDITFRWSSACCLGSNFCLDSTCWITCRPISWLSGLMSTS